MAPNEEPDLTEEEEEEDEFPIPNSEIVAPEDRTLITDGAFVIVKDAWGNQVAVANFNYHCRECDFRGNVQTLVRRSGKMMFWLKVPNQCLECGLKFNGVRAVGERWMTAWFTKNTPGFHEKDDAKGPQRHGKKRKKGKRTESIEVECPRCNAPIGTKCKTNQDRSHGARLRRARRTVR